MKRWNTKLKKEIENKSIDNFLNEINGICKKYNFSITHEDGYGAFQITRYDERNEKWLSWAHDLTE